MAMSSTLQVFIVSVACFMVVQALRKDHDNKVLNGKQKKKFWDRLITPYYHGLNLQFDFGGHLF